MNEFNNVTIIKAANVYFDGKVTSRTVKFADGTKKTLGIMMPGEYDFGTNEHEVMEILAGELTVLLPGETVWQAVSTGGVFEVPGNSRFKLQVTQVTDYCCSYLDK